MGGSWMLSGVCLLLAITGATPAPAPAPERGVLDAGRAIATLETKTVTTDRVLDRAIQETQRLLADPAANRKVPAGEARPTAPGWLARPAQTEPRIPEWARKHPDLVSLETQKTYGGHTAYAVTVTNRRMEEGKKVHVLFSQPHAHEPAATAGMMNLLSQLLEGVHLDGRPTSLPRQAWLDRCSLTFLPDGNPDGRARAPEDWWDGTKYSNREFLDFAFGRQADGQRCPRLGRWSIRQQQPALIGFVYEQINEHEYVEPNRDRDSTFFRLLARILAQRKYALHVDLHQTEFEKSEHNAMIILPCMQNELPEPIRRQNVELASAIVAAWQAGGGRPVPEAKPLGYGEEQLRYFRECWGSIYRSVPHVTVEIQNNNVRTPPGMQKELMEIAMRAAIEFALDKPRQPGGKGKDPRGEAIEAARHVVRSVVRAARENASSEPGLRREWDELTNRYVRQAAQAARELPPDSGPRALVTAIGVALDDSDILRTNPLTRGSCSQIESAEERAERLKVLGRPTMRGRRDLAQHFALSAYLAVELGSTLADAAGVAKELRDAQEGSGFSFADLAADEAGITFAERVLSGKLPLREVAERFSVADYLPPIDGLPEALGADEFQRNYTGESAARYEKLRSEIRSRVWALPPYRPRGKEQP